MSELDYGSLMDSEEQRLAPDTRKGSDYGAMMDTEAATQRQGLAGALTQAKATNPDQYAKIVSDAKAIGAPPAAVEGAPEDAQQKVVLQQADALLKTSPVLARQFATPEFAKLAHDDTDNLSLVESVVNGWKRGWRAMLQTPGAFEIAGTAQGAHEAARDYTNVTPGLRGQDPLGMRYLDETTRAAMGDTSRVPAAAAELARLEQEKRAIPSSAFSTRAAQAKTFADLWKLIHQDPAGFLSAIPEVGAESLLSSAPGMVAAVPAGIAAGPPGVAAAMGGNSFIVDYASQVLSQLQAAGVDTTNKDAISEALSKPEVMAKVSDVAARHALGVALFDAVSGGVAGKTLAPTAMKPLAREATNLALQAPVQGALGATGELTGSAMSGQEANPWDVMAEFVGEFAGTPAEVVSASAGRIYEHVKAAEAAVNDAQALQQLGELRKASKLAERDPQTFADFVQAAAEDGPVQDVYVDARVLLQSLQQGGVDATVLPAGTREQLADAVMAGGDVKIPIGEYTAHLAASDVGTALLPHLKTSPEGMSQTEAQVFMQEQVNNFKAEAEKIMTQPTYNAAWQEQGEQVRAHFFEQLAQANRFTPDVNNAYAAMMRDFYTTMAYRLGITPVEMLQRYPLRVAAENVANDVQMDQGSKVPQRVYHATNASFTEFKPHNGIAGWFSDSTDFANDYLKARYGYWKTAHLPWEKQRMVPEGANIIPAHLNLQNPFDASALGNLEQPLDDAKVAAIAAQLGLSGADLAQAVASHATERKSQKPRVFDLLTNPVVTAALAAKGFDGIKAVENGANTFAAFKPEQIKSAISGNGAGSSILEQSSVERLKEIAGLARAEKYLKPEERAKLRADTAERMLDILRDLPAAAEMAHVALAGQAKRGWYQHSAEAMVQVFGADAPRFAALLAAMSPQTSVESNLYNTLQTWKNWIKAGRPTARDKIVEIMGSSVEGNKLTDSVLPAWINNSVRALSSEDPGKVVLSGPKVNSFFSNLIGVADEVTNDTWMANYAAVEQTIFAGSINVAGTDPGKTPGYLAMAVRTRQAAEYLTKLTGEPWSAAEVQETVWSWAKTAYELADSAVESRSAVELVKDRAITDELIKSTPDFRSLFTVPKYSAILEKAGYGDQVRNLEGAQRSDASAGAQEPAAGGETGAPAGAAPNKHLLAAARRLDTLRRERRREGFADARRPARAKAAAGSVQEPGAVRGSAGEVAGEPGQDPVEHPVEGLPENVEVPGRGIVRFGPFKTARLAAQSYMERMGMRYTPATTYGKIDPKRGARIAQAFDEMKHAPNDPEVKAAYDAMIAETLEQWSEIEKTGLKIEFITGDDPYAKSPRYAHLDAIENNHLWVFPTDAGFGGSESANVDVSGNPLMQWTDIYIDGRRLRANDVFRIVHDYFGHIKEGFGFRAEGEDNAWQSHAAMYTPLARRAMTVETRGQNSWVNFGPYGKENKTASAAATQYAPQKTGLLPEWASFEGMLAGQDSGTYTFEQSATTRIRDKSGAPLLVHRGAASPLSDRSFNTERLGGATGHTSSGLGVFFTPSKGEAAKYGNVESFYLDIRNPYVMKAEDVPAFESAADATAFREALRAKGYDGIVISARHLGGGANIVAFDPTQVQRPTQLEQSTARGNISFGGDITQGANITLLKHADLSTFLHESGHFFLEVMADLAARPDAPPAIAADMAKALEWMGAKDIAAWRALPLEEKRPMHEKFARAFEAYLLEGKSPNPEMQSLFGRFRSWLLNVYRSLTALNVELTSEVRGVFDRMLATERQIADAEVMNSMAPMFTSPKEASAAPAEWESYVNLVHDATSDAVRTLERQSLGDLKWASNARDRAIRALQKEADEKRDAIRKEVTDEVTKEPVYRAMAFLQRGELDGDKVVGAKLSLAALKEMYGEDANAIWRYFPTGEYGMVTADIGLHPDVVAEMFGFTSGDELVRKLLAAEPMKSKIDGLTDQRMLERHGEMVDEQSIKRSAEKAVHNEARARFVASELRFLSRASDIRARTPAGGSVNVLAKAAKQFAEQSIARRKVKDIKPAQFASAEARAARAAMDAKSPIEKASEKRNQLVNLYAFRAAQEAVTEVERALRYLKKFDGDSTRKNLDHEYVDQIDALLERFDIRRATQTDVEKRESLAKWIERQRELGFEPTIDEKLAAEAARQHYSTMTLEEFRGLVEGVKNIEHLGRLKKKLLTAKDQREFAAVVEELTASIEAHATGTVKERKSSDRGPLVAIGGIFRQFAADHRKLASLMREMDGWKDAGPLWERIVRTMNDAGNAEAVAREKATIELSKLIAPILKGEKLGKKTYVQAIDRSLTREERIGIALNMGNEVNVERVMTGEKWTRTQLNAILDTLTKEEWDFVQSTWNYLDSFRPEMAAKSKRVTGVEPEWVEAQPVFTKHGEYKGGYYPIKYDPLRSSRAEADTTAEVQRQMERGLYVRAQTRRGHLEERVKSTGRPMRYDFGAVLANHVDQVVHDLSWHEWLIDANRLAKALDGTVREYYGPEKLRAIRDTLRDIAVGDLAAQTAGDKLLTHMRHGATVVGLGWRLTTALLQPIGLTQSASRIGTKWLLRGTGHWFGDAASLENSYRKISEKSDFMRLRAKTMQREINEIRNKVAGKDSKIEASYFYMITKMQLIADIPTWWGGYEKAMHENGMNESKAIALADQAVIDAQGGGQVKDLAQVQRGSAAWKLFTNFYSFFNTTYNLTRESVGRTNFKSVSSVGLLAADMALLCTIPALLGTLMKATLKGDWDDEDKFVRRLIADQVSYLMNTVVGLRELGGFAQKAAGLQGPDYSGPAAVRLFAAIEKLGQQTSQGEADEAFWKALNETAGLIFHYPAGQINATLDGMHALATGATENPGALLVGSDKN